MHIEHDTLTPAEYAALEALIGQITAYDWSNHNGVPSLIVQTRDYWLQFFSLDEVKACLKSGDVRPYRLPF